MFFSKVIRDCSSKIKMIGSGRHGHVQKSENHEHEGLCVFPKRNRKVTEAEQSNMKRNHYAELLRHSFSKCTVKMALRSPPDFLPSSGSQTPKSIFRLGIFGFSIGNLFFLRLSICQKHYGCHVSQLLFRHTNIQTAMPSVSRLMQLPSNAFI